MTRAVIAPRARRDLVAATRSIAKDNPAAARGLRAAAARAAARIGEHPQIGSLRPELARAPYRFMVLIGYPYILVYDAEREPPRIVRILHGARDLPWVLRDL